MGEQSTTVWLPTCPILTGYSVERRAGPSDPRARRPRLADAGVITCGPLVSPATIGLLGMVS